jgi:DNA-binding transcriptional LysR family regulator
MKSLPSLTALQAFEAVTRLRSFSLAATELNLTPSAISHQIAKLESQLETRLFKRTRTRVIPTTAGEQYWLKVSGALAILGDATHEVQNGARNHLYVHASPSFASLWLMPRLADFAKAQPHIALHLSVSHVHTDFASTGIDLDIRYGAARSTGLMVEPLFTETITPLASPEFIQRLGIVSTTELLYAPLIQSTVSVVQWGHWLQTQGLSPTLVQQHALRFDRAQLSIDAAVQGLGVALESTTIAQGHIEQGRLQIVLPQAKPITAQAHFAVYPEHHAQRGPVKLFLEWLRKGASL